MHVCHEVLKIEPEEEQKENDVNYENMKQYYYRGVFFPNGILKYQNTNNVVSISAIIKDLDNKNILFSFKNNQYVLPQFDHQNYTKHPISDKNLKNMAVHYFHCNIATDNDFNDFAIDYKTKRIKKFKVIRDEIEMVVPMFIRVYISKINPRFETKCKSEYISISIESLLKYPEWKTNFKFGVHRVCPHTVYILQNMLHRL
jgi:hypothetical protein